ncbi:MAG: hypothetical protein IKF01_03160 [Bacilli bacterium]|nr:hypothetical protein [Bacilli bacterium]
MKKTIIIGEDNVENLINQGGYYVDKSKIIEEVLNDMFMSLSYMDCQEYFYQAYTLGLFKSFFDSNGFIVKSGIEGGLGRFDIFVRKIDYNVSKLSRFERILLIMMENKKSKLKSLAKGDKELETMVKKVEDMSKDPNMVSYINDENLRRIAYDMDMEESNKKGHETGMQEKQREIVKNFFVQNVDINIISKATGLSIKEIEEIVK